MTKENNHNNSNKLESANKLESTDDIDKIEDKKDSKKLLLLIGAVVAVFVVFLLIRVFSEPEVTGKTIDDLHLENLQGKLDPSEGYLYNGYSFVKYAGLWYTDVKKGNAIVGLAFNNGPNDVLDIPVEGSLREDFFESDKFFITFDPLGQDLKYIVVANAGLSNALVKGFGLNLTAGCTRNETAGCTRAPIITCDDEDKYIFFFKEDNETKVVFDDNCVIIQGRGKDIPKAKDRLLLRWYGIMDDG